MTVFENFSAADVRDLIADYPLAWVAAAGYGVEQASLLPLLGDYGAGGRLVRLIGHMSRRNALVDALHPRGKALVLFTGPQAYISPDHARDRSWAPTWNYAQVRVEVELEFTPGDTPAAVERLVEAMEHGRADPWTVAHIRDRYEAMLKAIIAFRADVIDIAARFKLGQDEPDPVLASVLEELGDPAMCNWMRRFNRDRTGE
ncbi:FMN-binding negative transcriptional regulator [Stakelama saccharophila]|uniref:FMN-binding negative transcriptional regulator n=1 Tax=Stakelama saccharophila TaxID=3075605 RepID=A0ABZ0B9N6_9SPHN|nr:FMN-binding negative transcriptional regulator [Stakelama sp. W311]WNO54110.1 FMN-binding negative transcriptional regulator [Stakelama sp. W311]